MGGCLSRPPSPIPRLSAVPPILCLKPPPRSLTTRHLRTDKAEPPSPIILIFSIRCGREDIVGQSRKGERYDYAHRAIRPIRDITMRTTTLINALSAVAVATAGVMALDISDDLGMGWKMGLLPRQASANLQTFGGNLGGVAAPAVCSSVIHKPSTLPCAMVFAYPGPDGFFLLAGVESGFSIRARIREKKPLLIAVAWKQITKSNNPDRPFEVEGDTFVSLASLTLQPLSVRETDGLCSPTSQPPRTERAILRRTNARRRRTTGSRPSRSHNAMHRLVSFLFLPGQDPLASLMGGVSGARILVY